MLAEIRISGLGVISDAVLDLGPGLTVVTGETGAGKTMVVTGLALLFGGRADHSRLRPGVESASVEGVLTVNDQPEVTTLVTDAGGDIDADDSLVLRRVVGRNGRSRAAAGGASVPAAMLARLGEQLLAVHGQSDQLRLTRPVEQRQTLDRYAGLDPSPCREAFERWQAAEAELARRHGAARELAREADLLRHGLNEIAAVDPQPGEDVELAAAVARLEHADGLRIAARTAHDALLGDPDDPTADAADVATLLGAAARSLQGVAGTDRELDGLAERLAELATVTVDLGSELAGYVEQLDADPARLAAANERRAALAGLTRKYGPDIDAVRAWAADAEVRLAAADTSDEALAELAADRDATAAAYRSAALGLSKDRHAAATELSERITSELPGLAMPAASVRVVVSDRPATENAPAISIRSGAATKGRSDSDGTVAAGPDGIDEVAITLQSHPDAPELPVQRGASGGELSRVMLAIEVVLAGTDPVPTMVFDEIDAGVGGRAAVEIGRRLARLAADHQVVVVTHLAQVAAFADQHLVVDKRVANEGLDGPVGGVTRSDVRTVTGDDRLGELARMLAGADTAVARQHAAELLSSARPPSTRSRKRTSDR